MAGVHGVSEMTDILTITDLKLNRGTRQVLRGVNLRVAKGELVALMGLSGGGKTTILRSIAALETFNDGSITVDGVVMRPGPLPPRSVMRELRKRVGMVFQLHYLFDHLTAMQNVTLAPLNVAHVAHSSADERALQLLQSLGVAHRKDAYPRELSGGEAQRVAIARAMAMDPPLLLMDEPTASLDPERRAELGALLQGLQRQQRTLIISTHDEEFARDFATRILRLRNGQVYLTA